MRSTNRFKDALCRVVRPAVRFFCTFVFKLRVFDRWNVPAKGAAIIAVNHQSYLDPLFVGASLPRAIAFMARSSLFENRVFDWVLRHVYAYPVERDTTDMASMRRTIDLLREGRIVLVFPEGTRTRDGRVAEMKRGIGVLARRSGAPVVPTLVDGAFEAWPRSARLPVPAPVSVLFGPPMAHNETESDSDFSRHVRDALVNLQKTAATRRAQP